MFFALPNLVSKAVVSCVPWEFVSAVPEEVKGKENKKARTSWAPRGPPRSTRYIPR